MAILSEHSKMRMPLWFWFISLLYELCESYFLL